MKKGINDEVFNALGRTISPYRLFEEPSDPCISAYALFLLEFMALFDLKKSPRLLNAERPAFQRPTAEYSLRMAVDTHCHFQQSLQTPYPPLVYTAKNLI